MAMAIKNNTSKALQAHMAKDKKHSGRALLEWEMACNTNSKRGTVYNQSVINSLYGRSTIGNECGATKVCHLDNHNGNPFKYIVVKRFKVHGHDFAQGNQLIQEIECWEKLANTESGDYLCPILKYFTSKSDKVTENSATMKRNVVIIAQKAVYVGNAQQACNKAERLNKEKGCKGESASERYDAMRKVSDNQGWWDAMHNCGNSGVIFDYDKGCYKAVFIDYAL